MPGQFSVTINTQFISSGESAASAYETDAAVHAACQRRQRTFRVRTGRVELPNNYDKISDPVLIEISCRASTTLSARDNHLGRFSGR
ncbi:MAG: hypothetical protein ACI9VX_002220 [Dinoroseobacter sp.]|jgi:hypothetical protein